MTGTEDSHSTRPISVAELLAKNGTIGAPPVGGRRRRRRGNSDAVTVAELTGEIPVVSDDEEPELQQRTVAGNGTARPADVPLDFPVGVPVEAPGEASEYAEAPDDVEQRDESPAGYVGAEQMSPDPLDTDDEALDASVDSAATDTLAPATDDADELPSYLRSTGGPLFGGQTVADDAARRGTGKTRLEPLTAQREPATETGAETHEPQAAMSTFVRGSWVVGQSVVAVAFGAGLFVAFDQLWKWNNIVALVLSVLVILGLVVGVRVVRKTEDIASTLIAVAVGALVTLGPLALLQSN